MLPIEILPCTNSRTFALHPSLFFAISLWSFLFHLSSFFFSFCSHCVSPSFYYSVPRESNLNFYFYKWDSGLLFCFASPTPQCPQGIYLRVKEPGYHRVFTTLPVASFCILIQGSRTDTHKVGLWSWKPRDPTGTRINIYLYLLFFCWGLVSGLLNVLFGQRPARSGKDHTTVPVLKTCGKSLQTVPIWIVKGSSEYTMSVRKYVGRKSILCPHAK